MPNTSAKILDTLDIGDEFKIEETTKYLELSRSGKLIWSGHSSEENKLYFLIESTSEVDKDYKLIFEIKAVYFPLKYARHTHSITDGVSFAEMAW